MCCNSLLIKSFCIQCVHNTSVLKHSITSHCIFKENWHYIIIIDLNIFKSYHSSYKKCRNIIFFMLSICVLFCTFWPSVSSEEQNVSRRLTLNTTQFLVVVSLSLNTMSMSFQIYNGWADSNRESLCQRPTRVYGCKYYDRHTHSPHGVFTQIVVSWL